MKNIHILPTDRPSKLFYNVGGALLFTNYENHNGVNIYITSDEEPKYKDFYITNGNKIYFCNTLNPTRNNHYKKIILTTDQDLIKDCVQAIDEEFLEWFVENPSCEYVNFKKIEGKYIEYGVRVNSPILYKKIIQKEKIKDRTCTHNCSVVCGECQILQPKQETLEEAAEKYATSITKKWIKGDVCNSEKEDIIVHFVSGAKWQQEQDKNKYSEEDLISLLEFNYKKESNQLGTLRKDYSQKIVREWFEQFTKTKGKERLQRGKEDEYSEEEVGEIIYNVVGELAKYHGVIIDGAKLNNLFEQFKKK